MAAEESAGLAVDLRFFSRNSEASSEGELVIPISAASGEASGEFWLFRMNLTDSLSSKREPPSELFRLLLLFEFGGSMVWAAKKRIDVL